MRVYYSLRHLAAKAVRAVFVVMFGLLILASIVYTMLYPT